MDRILRGVAIWGLGMMMFAATGFGEELVIGVGNFKPYYIEEDENGIHLDLLKEVFQRLPHYVAQFKFMSNDRLIKEIVAARVDAAANVADRPELEPYYLSIPFFRLTLSCTISFRAAMRTSYFAMKPFAISLTRLRKRLWPMAPTKRYLRSICKNWGYKSET